MKKQDETEENILENAKAREIVQTVLDYGVSQNQIKQLIYLLALEVEDPKIFKGVSDIMKQKQTSNILGGE